MKKYLLVTFIFFLFGCNYKSQTETNCEQSIYYKENIDSHSLFELRNCFKPSPTKADYYKRFMISVLSDSLLQKKDNQFISRKNLLDLLEDHLNENYDLENDSINTEDIDKEILGKNIDSAFIKNRNNLVGSSFTIELQKLNENFLQIYSESGTRASNRYSLYNYNYKSNNFEKYRIDFILSELEKNIYEKSKINFYSTYSDSGTYETNINGQFFLVFKFSKKSDPACCPSLNIAILNKFDEYGMLDLKNVLFALEDENYDTLKWKSLN